MRPLLAVDGDSLAHRAYHALPKTIRRADGRPAGAVLGFANFLLRLWEAEQPRAVLVGFDTLEVPTYRHEVFPGYQGGREFDEAILEQLPLLPELVEACGFAVAKAPGYEADDFLAAASAAEEAAGGHALVAGFREQRAWARRRPQTSWAVTARSRRPSRTGASPRRRRSFGSTGV